MQIRPLLTGVTALLLTCASGAFAVTEADLLAISDKVFALDDAGVKAAFVTLRQAHVLEADGKTGDLRQQLTFKVLDANKPEVTAAFKLMIDKNVLPPAAPTAPAAPAPLSAVEVSQLETIKRALAESRQMMGSLDSMFSRLNQFGWVRERAELPGMISAKLDEMGSAYMRAKDGFKPFEKRIEPAIMALGEDVKRAQAQMESYYDRYNNMANE